ncbi:DoxX family membrane protein [Haloterrigena salifodinae]|uniref:DoxX family membrane protein n=1 Tax=Haloterrigena salifodinae TaxID=2675099 RepID=UPI000F876F94|nr:DoxX family membrane protein [Haloterrigena salifodinae]
MSILSQSEEQSDSAVGQPSGDAESAADSDVTARPLFRLGRVLFGGVLAFTAVDNLRQLEGRIDYADAKDAPLPGVTVPSVSGSLLLGGISVALWRAPAAGAAAIASFLIGTTPIMHDFWNEDDPQQQQQELTHFLKNTALLGAALAFLEVGQRET